MENYIKYQEMMKAQINEQYSKMIEARKAQKEISPIAPNNESSSQAEEDLNRFLPHSSLVDFGAKKGGNSGAQDQDSPKEGVDPDVGEYQIDFSHPDSFNITGGRLEDEMEKLKASMIQDQGYIRGEENDIKFIDDSEKARIDEIYRQKLDQVNSAGEGGEDPLQDSNAMSKYDLDVIQENFDGESGSLTKTLSKSKSKSRKDKESPDTGKKSSTKHQMANDASLNSLTEVREEALEE